LAESHDRFEPSVDLVSFSNRATEWFLRSDSQSKRLILETVGSNLSLKNKILSIEANKPFASLAKLSACPHRLGVGDDVRTMRRKIARLAKTIWNSVQDEDGQHILQNIRGLRERFEPEEVAKQDAAKKHPRAKVGKGAYRARGADPSWQMPLHFPAHLFVNAPEFLESLGCDLMACGWHARWNILPP
jgi:hypothetical protein